jgi:hypothetical protein
MGPLTGAGQAPPGARAVLLIRSRPGLSGQEIRAVHLATGILPLPPTRTPHGPVTWVECPHPTAFRLSREIDIFGALRTLGRIGGG